MLNPPLPEEGKHMYAFAPDFFFLNTRGNEKAEFIMAVKSQGSQRAKDFTSLRLTRLPIALLRPLGLI